MSRIVLLTFHAEQLIMLRNEPTDGQVRVILLTLSRPDEPAQIGLQFSIGKSYGKIKQNMFIDHN